MLRRVALVRTDVPPKRLLKQESHGVTSKDGILHSHRRENLNSYIALIDWAL
jgi:hypothetical protein